jgi:hypothetical protein
VVDRPDRVVVVRVVRVVAREEDRADVAFLAAGFFVLTAT